MYLCDLICLSFFLQILSLRIVFIRYWCLNIVQYFVMKTLNLKIFLTRKFRETEIIRFQNYWDYLTFLTGCQQSWKNSQKSDRTFFQNFCSKMETIYLTEPVYLLVDLVESINSYVFLELQTSAVQSKYTDIHTPNH